MQTRVILAIICRLTFQVIFNLIGNAIWLVRMITAGKLFASIRSARVVAQKIRAGESVEFIYMYKGVVKSDGVFGRWPTWTALPCVFAYRDFKGNCQDGAYFFKRASGGRVRVWIPADKFPSWVSAVHYVAEDKNGRVFSLGKNGVKVYASLGSYKENGAWI